MSLYKVCTSVIYVDVVNFYVDMALFKVCTSLMYVDVVNSYVDMAFLYVESACILSHEMSTRLLDMSTLLL